MAIIQTMGENKMQMDTKMIVEALKDDQKAKDEVCSLIDRLAESLSEEIDNLGQKKADRLERHAALGKRIEEESDAQADLLIRRKDLIMDIKAKLNGKHPEPIVLSDGEMDVINKMIEPKRKAGILSFGKKQRTA